MEVKSEKVQSLDEIVFENRNKEYGAYQLRKAYNTNVMKALSAAAILVAFVVVGPLIRSYASPETSITVLYGPNEVTKIATNTPPPPPPVKNPDMDQKQVKAAIFTAPQVVDSVAVGQEIATNDQIMSQPNDVEINPNEVFAKVVDEEKIIDEPAPIIHVFVEEMPEYPGGEEALRIELAKMTVYPRLAQEAGIEGKVFVRFVVTEKGAVEQVSIARKVDPLLDEEAVRVVKLLSKWKPGKQGGNPVNVWYTVPITFQLQKN
jgi:periplasmic protein TonB